MNEWITGDPESDVVWRDNSSGARGTIRKNKGQISYKNGDIVANHRDYEYWFDLFFVDTKTMKEANFLFINPNNIKSNRIIQEWLKVNHECPDTKIPIMPVKVRDRKTPEVILLDKDLKFNYKNRFYVELESNSFYLMMLKEFFELNKFEDLYTINSRKSGSVMC